MKRIPVDSANIKSIGHQSDLNMLEVEFANGSVYRYSGVTVDVYNKLLQAGRTGQAFQQIIRYRAVPEGTKTRGQTPYTYSKVIES